MKPRFFLYVTVGLTVLAVSCKDREYYVYFRTYEQSTTVGGFSEARLTATDEPAYIPSQVLMNGAQNAVSQQWGSQAQKKEEDTSIFTFSIDLQQSSSVKVFKSGKRVGVAENKALSAIRKWRYAGNRSGPVAIKFEWNTSLIYIDCSRLRGTSNMSNLDDLVKNGYRGFIRVLPFQHFRK